MAVGATTRLLFALPFVAGAFVALSLRPAAEARATADARTTTDARTIYLGDCATCHGASGGGTPRGPSILQSGRAGVDFYLTTGRMPLNTPHQAVERHAPHYDAQTIRDLTEYIAQLPGFTGPDVPNVDTAHANVAAGGVLFRLNCAACHASSGTGGALLHREAPPLDKSTPNQIVEALEVGPGNMPSFGAPSIDAAGQRDVAAYTRDISRNPDDRGGFPLWHLGPLTEGAAAVFAGLLLLLLLARAIGTRG
ncbi:MAG TPA: c-type cytochrome [Acidimicrobiia bacterium]|nr:c-type cytochrome [Acidimicrobiia bacterium]